jgi:hypothetical protein
MHPVIVMLHNIFSNVLVFFMKPVKYGAHTTLYCALTDNDLLEEGYYYNCCKRACSKWIYDDNMCKELWDISKEITGLDDTTEAEADADADADAGFGRREKRE